MSLSRVARFTVAPFVDWREHILSGSPSGGKKKHIKGTRHERDRRPVTDQHDELVVRGVVEDAVGADGLPQVLVNVVV